MAALLAAHLNHLPTSKSVPPGVCLLASSSSSKSSSSSSSSTLSVSAAYQLFKRMVPFWQNRFFAPLTSGARTGASFSYPSLQLLE